MQGRVSEGVAFQCKKAALDFGADRIAAETAVCGNDAVARHDERYGVTPDRIADGSLIVVDDLSLEAPKTKALVQVLKGLDAANALLVVKAFDETLTLASRNLPDVEVATASGASLYQMMLHRKVIVSQPAWEDLKARIAAPRKES